MREDVRDMLRGMWDTRWPLMTPFRAMRMAERELAVDVFEREGSIVVKAEMPGIAPDKIDVSISENELRISGERAEEKEIEEENYYRSERTYGHIFRALALPEGCNADGAAATVKDGVLEVVVPRKAAAKSKNVAVTSA
jgi:HSP20 family protein